MSAKCSFKAPALIGLLWDGLRLFTQFLYISSSLDTIMIDTNLRILSNLGRQLYSRDDPRIII